MTSFRADWLFTGASEPIRDGLLCVDRGRIQYAGPRLDQTYNVDFQQGLIIPGLVNAHTHLDLGELRKLGTYENRTGESFTGWLQEVIQYRRQSTPEGRAQAIRAGIHESLSSGTTLLADIAVDGESLLSLQQAPLRSVIYLELLGLADETVLSILRTAETWLQKGAADGSHWTDNHYQAHTAKLGLSPHAPYSIHRDALKSIGQLAGQASAPLAMHVAETPEELQLIEQRQGPFREFLQGLGVWHPENLPGSLEEVIGTSAQSPWPLLIHGNCLQSEHINKLPAHASVVYCPRTHARFSQHPHPYAAMLDCGINVALGTDSLASSADLSVLNEARFLWQRDRHRLAPSTLLAMATVHGATALGCADLLGTLAVGKYADFVVLRSSDPSRDPWKQLWENTTDPAAVFLGGERINH
jgi:cytosine/adenosine deaminase-related metal-dependent hydrolase